MQSIQILQGHLSGPRYHVVAYILYAYIHTLHTEEVWVELPLNLPGTNF